VAAFRLSYKHKEVTGFQILFARLVYFFHIQKGD